MLVDLNLCASSDNAMGGVEVLDPDIHTCFSRRIVCGGRRVEGKVCAACDGWLDGWTEGSFFAPVLARR